MRILVNDIAASKTGALAILLDFYEYVKEKGGEHEWIFLTGIDCLKDPPENIRVQVMDRVKRSQKDRLIFDLITGSSFIESLEPDLILSLQNTLTLQGIKRLGSSADGRYKKGDRVPQVLYVHQPLGFQKLKRFSFLKAEEREYAVYQYLIGAMIDASVKRADRVIVQTEWMREAVAKKCRIPLDRIAKVMPEVDSLEGYRVPENFDPKHFFFPSGEILYKNHECVLKAAAILNKRGIKDFKVHFTLKSLADVTKREYPDPYGNIFYSGRVSRKEVLSEYSRGTLLFPSYIETFGVPLAEARQTGTLILASDTPFSREVLDGYKNAYFFDPFREEELADLMQQVIEGGLAPDGNSLWDEAGRGSVGEEKESESGYGRLLSEMLRVFR